MAKIIILLSTYNGTMYLKSQLNSLLLQTCKDFEIIIRDDKSNNTTIEILKSYDIKLLESKENLGAKQSFAKLLEYALQNSDSNYFMFCDQDDVWHDNKVEKTLIKIQEMEKKFGDIPLLVHTNLEVTNENLHTINDSFMNFQKINPMKNQFNSLLMQNTITGCTVMINRKLAQKCLPTPEGAIMHDWWIGLVASYFGTIGYIDEATIKYRQHTSNTIGAKEFGYWEIIKKGFDIYYKIKIDANISQAKAFLEQYKDELDVDTIKILQDFTTLEKKRWWQKRLILWKYKLLKQGFIRNVGLFLKI